jgi:thioredoxin 2
LRDGHNLGEVVMDAGPSSVVACDRCRRKNRVPSTASGTPRCGSCHSPLAWVVDADDRTYGAVVAESPVPVLVDLWAPWCGPCRMVSPSLERLAHEFAGQLKLVKVNVDDAPATSARFAVQGIPTLVMVDRGGVVARQVGAAGEPALRDWIRTSLPPAAARS